MGYLSNAGGTQSQRACVIEPRVVPTLGEQPVFSVFTEESDRATNLDQVSEPFIPRGLRYTGVRLEFRCPPLPWELQHRTQRHTMKLIGLLLASWVVGLAAYIGALALFYRQPLSSGDLAAVLLGSLVAFTVVFFALYLPVLLGVRRLLRGVRPLWPFPVLAVLLGLVPTALILLYWGGGTSSLFSPEACLFYAMFAAIGVAVGLGFAFIYRHDRAA
jgi:hypothetical protein